MSTLGVARTRLADAVTAAGMPCAAYPPDAIVAPAAFVDSMTGDTTSDMFPGSFCLPTVVAASVVTLAQRNDLPGAMDYLEGLVAPILAAFHTLPGVRVLGWASGLVAVQRQELPAVTYSLTFHA